MSLIKQAMMGKMSSMPSMPHAKDLMPQMEFERQQPIINELVARFERLQNKRESFRAAVARPDLPVPPMLSPPRHLVKPSKVAEVDISTLRLDAPGNSKPKASASSSTVGKTSTTPQNSVDKAAGYIKASAPPPQSSTEKPVHSAEKAGGPAAKTIQKKKTRPVLTMDALLQDAKLREHFREFIETAYAAENLDFYEFVERYSSLASDKDRSALGKRVVDEFVRPTSPNQVNLPSALATKLAAAVDAGNGEETTKLFAQARHEICALMQTNFMDKFLSVVGQPAYVPEEDSEEEKDEDAPEKKAFFKEWVKKTHHKTGEVYFENPQTGVTMWDVPKPIGIVPPPLEPPPYF